MAILPSSGRSLRTAARRGARWAPGLLLVLFGGSLAAQQIEVQQLGAPGGELVAAEDLADDRDWAMEDLLWQADQLAATEDKAAAVELYGEVLELVAPGGRMPATAGHRQALLRSLLGRAGANLGRNHRSDAEEDLERLLSIEPDFDAAELSPSAELSAALGAVRDRFLGTLSLTLDPDDATVRIDGRPLPSPSRSHFFPPGSHELRVERPGFEAEDRSIELRAGRQARESFQLRRTSATIRFGLIPADAWIEIDGWKMLAGGDSPACVLEDPADTDPAAPASCRIGGLDPGAHEITIGREGRRSHRFQFEILDLEDYQLPDVALEPTAAEIRLSGLPLGAQIQIDGATVGAPPGSGEEVRLPIAPGDHRIVVNAGGDGLFEQELTLSDRQSLSLAVQLRPSIGLVGVLGPDRVAAADLAVQLEGDIGALGEWAFLDLTARGPEVFVRQGDEANRLRPPNGIENVDWSRIQGDLDRELPASIHLLAVLSDEPYASGADLWVLPGAPGPAWPVRLRTERPGDRWTPALLAALAAPLVVDRTSLGAELADIPGAPGPRLTRTTPGGAAAVAGLQPGQTLVALGGKALADAADLRARLASAVPGERLELSVDSGPVQLTTVIEPRRSPVVVSPGNVSALYPFLWARLRWLARQGTIEPWVVELNRAALYLASGTWSEAVAVLRSTQPPERAGLGRATAQYWLGLALLAEDAAGGREAAIRALQAAAGDPEARLDDDEGPRLAPRAALILGALSAERR